jgi:hypothetical protein
VATLPAVPDKVEVKFVRQARRAVVIPPPMRDRGAGARRDKAQPPRKTEDVRVHGKTIAAEGEK